MYAPKYTTREVENIITIESNEVLAQYQDVYVIDKNGDRHDYTFDRETDTELTGVIKFSNFPFGIATIYARLKDEVDNFSNVISASIEIKESLTLLNLEIRNFNANVNINDSCREISNVSKVAKIDDRLEEGDINV